MACKFHLQDYGERELLREQERLAGGHRSRLFAAAAATVLACAADVRAATFADGVAAEGRADYRAAVDAYRDAAGRGDAPAQYALGRMYRDGRGVNSDHARAVALFRAAAVQGNPAAEFELATMLRTGDGVHRNRTEASQWISRAASAGFAPAELKLARAYESGEGVPRDLAEAANWAAKAAEQGDLQGQIEAGRLWAEAARGDPPEPSMIGLEFHAVMDLVFGPHAWRETSGYRTPAKEAALRSEGAGTVPVGVLSRHSMGAPGRPGAYDVVVSNLSNRQAAARLLRSGASFRRVVAENAHGPEGPHLHIEPMAEKKPGRRAPAARKINGAILNGPTAGLSKRERDRLQAVRWLGIAAARGSAAAQSLLEDVERAPKPARTAGEPSLDGAPSDPGTM